MSEYEKHLTAVKNNGDALQDVPDELKTYDMCLLAVSRSEGEALEHVPEQYKTYELCLEALEYAQESHSAALLLVHVPPQHHTREFYTTLLENGVLEEEHIPNEYL